MVNCTDLDLKLYVVVDFVMVPFGKCCSEPKPALNQFLILHPVRVYLGKTIIN